MAWTINQDPNTGSWYVQNTDTGKKYYGGDPGGAIDEAIRGGMPASEKPYLRGEATAIVDKQNSTQQQPPQTASQAASDDGPKGPNAPAAAKVGADGRVVPPPDTTAPTNADKPTKKTFQVLPGRFFYGSMKASLFTGHHNGCAHGQDTTGQRPGGFILRLIHCDGVKVDRQLGTPRINDTSLSHLCFDLLGQLNQGAMRRANTDFVTCSLQQFAGRSCGLLGPLLTPFLLG